MLANRQVVDARIGIHADAIVSRHLPYPRRQILERFVARKRKRDILRHRQGLEQRKMLENHADTKVTGMLRAADGDLLAAPFKAAGIGLQQPVHHLHKG